MTAHFIEEYDDRFELIDRILCTREMNAEIKDGPFIRSQIKEHLKSYNLYSYRKECVFVSDRGSNMVAALKHLPSIHCFAHMLNNTVQLMLQLIQDKLAPVKSLVKYFKVTGLNSGLDASLKSYVKARWNSVYNMIKSVVKDWAEIQEILISKNETRRIAHINVETLKVYLSHLVLFVRSSLILQFPH